MSNKTAIWVILGIVIVIGGLVYAMSGPMDNSVNSEDNSYKTTDKVSGKDMQAQGRVVFSVTDAAVDIKNVSEINMQVKSVDVHSNTGGWITVSSTPRTYSLLELNKNSESKLLADAKLNADTYDQVRLEVDSVTIKTKDGKTKNAKLPSGELRINTKLVVENGQTSSVNMDFLADKSLHTTGKGEYIFAPVVKTETRNSSEIKIDGTTGIVIITGGDVDDTKTFGMDVDGSLKADFQIKSTQKLDIGTDNKIQLGL